MRDLNLASDDNTILSLLTDREKATFFNFCNERKYYPPFVICPKIVSYEDSDHETFSFTNYFEAELLNFLNLLMFDPVEQVFKVEKLERLKTFGCRPIESLLSFYRLILTSLDKTNTQKTQNAFVQLVSDLNISETLDPIIYRAEKGKKIRGKNGTYRLAVGLDNLLRVFGRLLGDPTWSMMRGSDMEMQTSINKNLTRLCELFSNNGFNLQWDTKGTEDQTIFQVFLNNQKWVSFELHTVAGCRVYDNFFLNFNLEYYYSLGMPSIGVKIIKAERPWQPYFSLFISSFKQILDHDFRSPETFATYIKGYLFPYDFDTLGQRVKALRALFIYKYKLKINDLDYLIQRWLKPTSRYFHKWENDKTNRAVLNVLCSVMTPVDIRALNIPQLSRYLEHNVFVSIFSHMVHQHLSHLARLLLKQDGRVEAFVSHPPLDLEEMAIDYCGNASVMPDDSSEDENEQLEEVEANPPTLSLMHCLASLGLSEFMEKARVYGCDVNGRCRDGETPLHLASNSEAARQLLALDANPSLLNNYDQNPLDSSFSNGRFKVKLDVAEALLNFGVRPSHVNYIDLEGEGLHTPHFQLLLKNDVSFELYPLKELVYVTLDTFKEMVKKFPPGLHDYSMVLKRLAAEGDVEKILVLREEGLSLSGMSFNDPFETYVSDERRYQVVKLLMDNGVQLSEMESLNSGNSVLRSHVKLFLGDSRALSNYIKSIRSEDDLDELISLRKRGSIVSLGQIRWDDIFMNQRIKICIKLLEAGFTLDEFSNSLRYIHILGIQQIVESVSLEMRKLMKINNFFILSEGDIAKVIYLRSQGMIVNMNLRTNLFIISDGKRYRDSYHMMLYTQETIERRINLLFKLIEVGVTLFELSQAFKYLNMTQIQRVIESFSPEARRSVTLDTFYVYSGDDLEKLRYFREQGFSVPIKVCSFTPDVLMDQKVRICIELIEEGIALNELFPAFNSLDIPARQRVIESLPPEAKSNTDPYDFYIRSKDDIEAIRYLRGQGFNISERFLPFGSNIPMEDRVKYYQEIIQEGIPLHVLFSYLSDLDVPGFQRVIGSIPSEVRKSKTLSKFYISSEDDIRKLNYLRAQGFSIPSSNVSFLLDFPQKRRDEILSELISHENSLE